MSRPERAAWICLLSGLLACSSTGGYASTLPDGVTLVHSTLAREPADAPQPLVDQLAHDMQGFAFDLYAQHSATGDNLLFSP